MRRTLILLATAGATALLAGCAGSPMSSTSEQDLDVREASTSYFYYQTMPDGYKMLCVRYDRGPSCDWVGYHIHIGDLPKPAAAVQPSS